MILSDRYNYPQEFFDRSLDALHAALYTAPAYREWAAFDPGTAASLEAKYDALPELTKQIMRENFPAGLAPRTRSVDDGLLREEIEFTFTSGTTGERVVNIWDQDWWDRAEAASWKLNNATAALDYPQKEAKLASSLNVGISCEEDLPMESRILGNRLYLNEKINTIQWQPRHFERMARELKIFKPVILEANPSLLARLAFWAADNNVKLYSPAAIIFTFEFISKIHLAAVQKVFSSPVISSYGTTETGFVLEECEKGFLHQNTDFCRIDFHPLKDKFGGPDLGRMLVTTFQNPWNKILRFDVGDLIRLHPSGTCACGRSTGLIADAIEGRASNATFAADGSLVTTMAVDNALSGIEGLRDYHLDQNDSAHYDLQIMLRGDESVVSEQCRTALDALYGGGDITVRVLKDILPGQAGKFRRTQANFDFDVKELFV